MLNVTQITPPRVPFLDERSGMVSREWYRFFLNLYSLTGSGTSSASLEDLQLGPSVELVAQADTNLAPLDVSYAAGVDQLSQALSILPPVVVQDLAAAIQDLALAPPATPQTTSNASLLPNAITVGASPYSYQNTTSYAVDVLVSGGTVSAVDFTRDNTTFYSVGVVAGMFTLSPYDRLRVTYTVAPTMTLIPR